MSRRSPRLVVLIDALDHCLPATSAIQTQEAIRLFLFVPKSAFVIGAYDEAMNRVQQCGRQFSDLPLASGQLPDARNVTSHDTATSVDFFAFRHSPTQDTSGRKWP